MRMHTHPNALICFVSDMDTKARCFGLIWLCYFLYHILFIVETL